MHHKEKTFHVEVAPAEKQKCNGACHEKKRTNTFCHIAPDKSQRILYLFFLFSCVKGYEFYYATAENQQ